MQSPSPYEETWPEERRRRRRGCCCSASLGLLAAVLLLTAAIIWLVVVRGGRTNVLVLGLDRRPGEGDAVRADTIMVVTSNAAKPAFGILSIPRDLYLLIPDQGENRINSAHVFGEMARPGGGPERTVSTITQNFNIPIDGWVRIDFDGFVSLIDAVGGVEIDVAKPIIDYAFPTDDYGVMTIEIPAGRQQMDGERALQYARSRHGSTDYDRAKRQQQVVQALIRRLITPSTWPRLPAFYSAYATTVETDLSFGQLVRLGLGVLLVGPDGMERLVIDQELVSGFTTSGGASVLAPRWELIRPKINELFDLE